jgi:hypothetical protein
MAKKSYTDEELKPMMVSLLETQIGFEIGMFDMLTMFQLEDGRYGVYNQPDCYKPLFQDVEEHLFEKAEDAVDLFLKFRCNRQLGFDHECGWADDGDWLRPEYDLTKLKPVPPEVRQRRLDRHANSVFDEIEKVSIDNPYQGMTEEQVNQILDGEA